MLFLDYQQILIWINLTANEYFLIWNMIVVGRIMKFHGAFYS